MRRQDQKIPCPQCGKPMCPGARHGCRECSRGGIKRGINYRYAKALGIPVRRINRLGGEARLSMMSEEARTLILQSHIYGNSQTVNDGGLRARGMKSRIPGRLTQTPPPS